MTRGLLCEIEVCFPSEHLSSSQAKSPFPRLLSGLDRRKHLQQQYYADLELWLEQRQPGLDYVKEINDVARRGWVRGVGRIGGA